MISACARRNRSAGVAIRSITPSGSGSSGSASIPMALRSRGGTNSGGCVAGAMGHAAVHTVRPDRGAALARQDRESARTRVVSRQLRAHVRTVAYSRRRPSTARATMASSSGNRPRRLAHRSTPRPRHRSGGSSPVVGPCRSHRFGVGADRDRRSARHRRRSRAASWTGRSCRGSAPRDRARSPPRSGPSVVRAQPGHRPADDGAGRATEAGTRCGPAGGRSGRCRPPRPAPRRRRRCRRASAVGRSYPDQGSSCGRAHRRR